MRYIQNLIITLMLTASYTAVNAQCASGSFNCNDTIQVSVNEMCQAIISADMVLEQPEATCTYFLRFFDENDVELTVPGNTLGVTHVGKLIKVKVEENGVTSPNSCWAFIRVEDKIPAIIECPEFPIFSCLDSDSNDPGRTNEELAARIRREIISQGTIEDNCTDTASFEVSIIRNELKQLLCSEDFGAQRFIEYDLIGIGGLVLLNCVDTLFFDKFDSEEIDDPKDFTGADALECDGTWRRGQWEVDIDQDKLDEFDIDIYPNFKELFAIDQTSFPNIGGRPLVEYDDELEAFVRKGFCNINAAFTDLPPFEICGKSYKLIRSWTIIDWCKQSVPRVVNQIIEVKDTKAPEFTVPNIPDVAAGTNTCNMVLDLPMPTVTDECNDWFYCIAFKYPGSDQYVTESKYQNLDSGDVADPVILPIGTTTILYAVKDECGNADSIRMDVDVNDIQPPIAICDTRTVLSLNNNNKGKIFPPTIDDKSFDNCTIAENLRFRIWREDGNTALNAPDSSFVKFDGDDIGNEVRVMLEVRDEGGLANRCWTTVELPFSSNVLDVCPPNPGLLDVCSSDVSLLSLENGIEAVEVDRLETGCGEGLIFVQYIDTTQGDRIVICQDTLPFGRLASINLADVAMPADISVEECADMIPTEQNVAEILNSIGSCNVEVIFQDVIFSEKIFRNFTVLDVCTNVSLMHHTQIIEIIPADLEGVDLSSIFDVAVPGSTIEMDRDGVLEITGDDLNTAVGDECISNLDIRIRKRDEGEFGESVSFTCADLATIVVFDLEVALYDRDGVLLEVKNTKVLIDDRITRACPAGSSINIGGFILTEENEAVENVTIELRTLENQKVSETITSTDGEYAFTQMNPEQYKLVTSRNDEIINGVSTLDLVLIQQHILGINTFDSPFKVIAADINNNETVSAADLVELRKVVLGISDQFSNNASWRFAEKNQTFSDILNPWPFNEVMDISASANVDFIGIKIGDVNSNAIANSLMTDSRSTASIDISMSDVLLEKGKKSLIEVGNASNDQGLGFQMSLKFDERRVNIVEVYDAEGKVMNPDNYVIDNGTLTISHIDFDLKSTLYMIELDPVKTSQLSSVVSLSTFDNEWYNTDLETYIIRDIKFEKETEHISVSVTPNPFDESTNIHIESLKRQNVNLTIYNMNGIEVYQQSNINLTRGDNRLNISSSDLSHHTGIYIYNVEFGDHSVRGKMVYLD